MNKKLSEIIEDVNSLPDEDKNEVFKILFLGPLSDKDLQLMKWTLEGIQGAREAGKKLDKAIEILDNAKKRTKG